MITAADGSPRGPRTRAVLRTLIVLVGGPVAAVVLLGLLSVLLARGDVQRGVARTEEGLAAARDGDSVVAAARFSEAQRAFRGAHRDLAGWLTAPASRLPVLGTQLDSLRVATDIGADLAGTAAAAAESARLEDLQVRGGRVDLDHLRSMAGPLEDVRAALDRAEASLAEATEPWLVSPVATRLHELERLVGRAIADADTASEAVEVLPGLLGADGPRSYFVAFGTPAETRELGGFMGAFAMVVADDGRLHLGTTGRVGDLNRAFERKVLPESVELPATYRAFQPQRFWHNLTSTPDFPTMAGALRQLWPAKRLGEVDGVIYMDPAALASLLELTGPIRVPDHAEPLTAETAGDFLLREQYVAFPDDDRHDFLLEAGRTVFRRLTSGELPEAQRLVEVLGPAVKERRLLVNSAHADEQELFERLDVDGALPPVRGDFLSVRASNLGLNKIDAFMHRTVTYDVRPSPLEDRVEATVTVAVENRAPAHGLPDTVIGNRAGATTGTNSTLVVVYSPLELTRVTSGGRPFSHGAHPEYGRHRYTAMLDVPAGETSTVVFELQGTLDLSGGYHLDVVPQPLVQPDQVEVTVEAPPGWRALGEHHREGALRYADELDVLFSPFGG